MKKLAVLAFVLMVVFVACGSPATPAAVVANTSAPVVEPPTTGEINPDMWYRLTNNFLGEGRSLDTYSGDKNDPFMGETGNFIGQFWKLTPQGDGTYRLTNKFLGEGRSLDTYSGDKNAPFMGETSNFSGQFWKLTPQGDGTYRLTNKFLGEGRSLDTYSGDKNAPFMGETGNFSGQFWKLTPIEPIK
jgi:hypothetical protein